MEQQEEAIKRSEERMIKLDERKSNIPALEEIQEDSKQRLAQMRVQVEQTRLEKEKLQQEEREFRQQLLAELGRHNLLLEQFLSRLT